MNESIQIIAIIGDTNFDVGHVISTNVDGDASLDEKNILTVNDIGRKKN